MFIDICLEVSAPFECCQNDIFYVMYLINPPPFFFPYEELPQATLELESSSLSTDSERRPSSISNLRSVILSLFLFGLLYRQYDPESFYWIHTFVHRFLGTFFSFSKHRIIVAFWFIVRVLNHCSFIWSIFIFFSPSNIEFDNTIADFVQLGNKPIKSETTFNQCVVLTYSQL